MSMKIVIIGAGPAGITVAETLRQYDKNFLCSKGNKRSECLEIIMLSSEPYPPYSPPAMLQYFITGEEAHLWKWEDMPQRLGLDYRPGKRVVAVIPQERAVRLSDDSTLNYDRLVIASGSRLFAPITNADKPGIYNFKSLSAANSLIKEIREGRAHSAIIVGAGFIGIEIALLLSDLGVKIILIEMTSQIMPGMLDKEIAEIALNLLLKRGIDIRLNSKATSFLGDSKANAVELESGEILKAEILIAATGVKPNIDFLNGSGIKTDWGIVVDQYFSTNIPGIYAAGDVAETKNRITNDRSVYPIFPNAIAHGKGAAYNLLGFAIPYEGSDNMNSLKHLGLPIMASGIKKGEELCMSNGYAIKKIYIQNDSIVGFQMAGDIKGAGLYRSLMNNKVNIRSIKDKLLEANFGIGYIFNKALYQNIL